MRVSATFCADWPKSTSQYNPFGNNLVAGDTPALATSEPLST